MPSDLRACFSRGGVNIPEGPLSIGEVSRLWGQDRVRIVALQQCGNRFANWYDQLRASWR